MVKNKEKGRQPNYTGEEKLLLMNVVAKYKNIVECKKTNASSWSEKQAAWGKIAAEFNAQSPAGVPRDQGALKKLYENKKAEARKMAANNRQERRATGGGTFTPKTDPCLDILMDITNRKTIEGLECEFGGDVDSDGEKNVRTPQGPQEWRFDDDQENDSNTEVITIMRTTTPNKFRNTTPSPFATPTAPKEPAEYDAEDENSGGKTTWTNYKAKDLKKKPNEKLLSSARRRPKVIQPVHTNFLSRQYSEVAELKAEYLKNELKYQARKNEREEEEFQLRKRTLELDIQLKQAQLKRLRNSFE